MRSNRDTAQFDAQATELVAQHLAVPAHVAPLTIAADHGASTATAPRPDPDLATDLSSAALRIYA